MSPEQTSLVESHVALVPYFIHKHRLYPRPGYDTEEDIIGDGNVGLTRAASMYDPAKGVPFTSFALTWIRFAIFEGQRLRFPMRYEQTAAFTIGRSLASTLHSIRGTPPSTQEVDSLVPGYAKAVLAHRTHFATVPLDAPTADGLFLHDVLKADAPSPADVATDRALLASIIEAARLTARQRRIIYLHYFEGVPFSELAKADGVCRERINQIHRKALERLRKAASCSTLQETQTTSSENFVPA